MIEIARAFALFSGSDLISARKPDVGDGTDMPLKDDTRGYRNRCSDTPTHAVRLVTMRRRNAASPD